MLSFYCYRSPSKTWYPEHHRKELKVREARRALQAREAVDMSEDDDSG